MNEGFITIVSAPNISSETLEALKKEIRVAQKDPDEVIVVDYPVVIDTIPVRSLYESADIPSKKPLILPTNSQKLAVKKRKLYRLLLDANRVAGEDLPENTALLRALADDPQVRNL